MSANPNENLYEEELFVEPPDEELKCPICLCVMKRPQQLSVCQHMFCGHCITAHFQSAPVTNFCPIDKRTASISNLTPAPRAITNIINRLQIRCFYHNEGCREIMRVENIDSHALVCRFSPCRNQRGSPSAQPPQESPGSNIGPTINVFVKLAAPAKTIVVTINKSDSVITLKQRIHEKEGVDPNNMVLNFKARTLVDSKKLSEYGVKNNDLFYVTRRFEGGH